MKNGAQAIMAACNNQTIMAQRQICQVNGSYAELMHATWRKDEVGNTIGMYAKSPVAELEHLEKA